MRPAARHWLHLAVVVALVLGIAALVQAFAERHSLRLDLTPARAHSLSEPTRRVLATLRDPIDVTIYHQKDERQEVTELADLFRGEAPNFRAELLDLDRYPGRARQDGVDRYGKAVIRYRDQRVVVDAMREQTIAGGLLRLARGRAPTVRFLQGHGERDATEVAAPIGYGEMRQALLQESYDVAPLNLLEANGVPPETDLLIVAGPKNDLLEQESAAIDRYLDAGGHVLLLIDPVPLPNLERLAARRGITSPLDVVVDRANRLLGSDPFTIAVPGFRTHPITSASTTPALFAVARSVEGGRPMDERAAAHTIAETYPDAWAVRDFERAGRAVAEPREPEDRRGPVPVVAAASWPAGDGESRLVVVGDSDFGANGFLGLLGNRDLLFNAIGWAVSADALIAARPHTQVTALRPLSPLILSGRQGKAIFFFLVVFQPALVLAFGTTLALRKRWRG